MRILPILTGLFGAVLLAFLCKVTRGQGVGEFPSNTPKPRGCDIGAITTWATRQTEAFWLDLANKRDVPGMCEQISEITTMGVDCLRRYVEEFIKIWTALGVQLPPSLGDDADTAVDYALATIAHFELFCGTEGTDLKICNIAGVIDCSAAAIIGFQQQLELSIADLGNVCIYYNDLVKNSGGCMDRVYMDCPKDNTVAENIKSQKEVVFKYLQDAQQYCQEDCGEVINFLAGINTKCPDIYNYNWQGLSPQTACTTIKEYVDCTEYLITQCNIIPMNIASPSYEWATLMIALMGCDFGFFGMTVDLLPRSNEIAIPCAAGMYQCVTSTMNIFGIDKTSGPDGGWNVDGVATAIDDINKRLISGQFTQICDEIKSWYMPVVNCTSALVDNCIPGASANSDALLARMILVDNITHYLYQICHAECQDLQRAFQAIDDTCTSQVLISETSDAQFVLDFFAGFITLGAASQNRICKIVNNWLNCVLPELKECPALYENWLMLAQLFSGTKLDVYVCGLHFDVSTGRVELDMNSKRNFVSVIGGGNQLQMSATLIGAVAMMAWKLRT